MKAKYLVILSLVVMLGMVIESQPAYADSIGLRYRLADGSGIFHDADWTYVYDGGVGDTSNISMSQDGFILLDTTAGMFDIVTETGQGSPPLPNLNLDLSSSVTTISGGTGKLQIQFSQRNLSPSASGWNLNWGPLFSGTGLSTTLRAYAGSDSLFDTASLLASASGPVTTGGVISLSSPYSLTLDIVFDANGASGGASSEGDALLKLNAVPEPSVLLLLGTGLVFGATLSSRSRLRSMFRR